MTHRLDPLLKPSSVALLGASERENSPGRVLAEMIIQSDFSGDIFPINPGSSTILGLPCFKSLDSLPKQVEHVIIALGTNKLEQALQQVVDHGAKAVTIYAGTTLENDTQPNLQQRLTAIAKSAGLQMCGANGMGFYNIGHHFNAGIFPKPPIRFGGISHIAQSGTAFATLTHNGCRMGFNLCVSSGNELTTSVADYIDWSLEQPETKVISLFLETVRDPDAFIQALEKARNKQIPVVVLKIGKSALSAKMAISHTGAIAGNHTAFEAVFRRYGVLEVDDLDELAATVSLFQHFKPVGRGQFAAMFESGGLRELVADIAQEVGLEFAPLEDATRITIQANLDPGLKAENPLDAWGSHERFEERFTACLMALMADPNVAGGAFMSPFRDDYYLHEAIYRAVEKTSRVVNKPIALATTYSDLENQKLSDRGFEAGIPLIQGTRETLLAFKKFFGYQDWVAGEIATTTNKNPEWKANGDIVSRCQKLFDMNSDEALGEDSSLNLLAEYGVPVVMTKQVNDEAELIKVSQEIGFPLVLKTAEAGIHHKSDSGGVVTDIADEQSLLNHYSIMRDSLGPKVQIAKMIKDAVEVSLGCINDPQFGPLLIIAAGGVLIELMDDRKSMLCPVDEAEVNEQIAAMKIVRLLKGYRGKEPANVDALVDCIVRFSRFAFEFQDRFSEIDINPVMVNSSGCYAVDALIIR